MSAALKIVDETPTGKVLHESTLILASETVSARDIVEGRVREEVARFNAQRAERTFLGLVQPTDAEVTLNGYQLRKWRPLDAEAQVQKAFEAFERNGFLMLADDQQVDSLDESILITPDMRVSFVKLVPLVGG